MITNDGNDEACFFEPYPSAGPLQNKRAIARAIGTTYIYDFLGLIEKAMLSVEKANRLGWFWLCSQNFFQAEEAVFDENTKELTWKKEGVPGQNKIGMVGVEMHDEDVRISRRTRSCVCRK